MPRNPTIPVVCEQCGKTFLVHPCRVGKARFCSKPCKGVAMRNDIDAAFWAKINKHGPTSDHCPELGPCWLWIPPPNVHGYGQTQWLTKMWTAHRLSWTIHNGPIPDGLDVCHHCDNRACVNPMHFFLGTHQDNMDDMHAKGRGVRGERVGGAKLREADVRTIVARISAGDKDRAIADDFSIGRVSITDIRLGRRWRHITGFARPRS